MTRPFFSRDRISHFDNFDRHAEDAIRQFKDRLHEGHPVDFQVSFLLPYKVIGKLNLATELGFPVYT